MTRECAADFEKIKTYIEEYNISSCLAEKEYTASLKTIHRCYFSAITWNAELLHRKKYFLNENANRNDDIVFYLNEVVSDLGSSLFNWMNGNYKASRVMLRVAIESFIRAASALEDKGQLKEKNVYQIFNNASIQPIFSNGDLTEQCYTALHADYKLLCKDAHTATIQNMEHLTSLADLPAFNKQKSEDTADIYIRASKNISSLFCMLFNNFFHTMHHRNKENILNGLNRDIKPIILGANDINK